MGFTLPEEIASKLIFSIITLAIAYIIASFTRKAVDVLLKGLNSHFNNQESFMARTSTIRSLFKNFVDVMILLLAILIILSRWDINIIPFITGAGIIGLALSFGAQTLVKDVISGFFIIVEDQFCIGDKVKIGNYEGVVEILTLRLTILRDKNGHLIYIPNSQINTVIRYTNPSKASSKS